MEDKENSYKKIAVDYGSKSFSDESATLNVSNRGFYSNRGSIGIDIRSNVTRACIAFSVIDNDQINELKSVFKPIKGSRETVIRTPTEAFTVSNKLADNCYIIGINKLVITSSGRSKNGISVILWKNEMEQIYDILCGFISVENLKKKKK